MKVTQVSILPTMDAKAAGRPAVTPELLAATGARYSRSNEGLEHILSRIDPLNPGASVDSIFEMVDYGHRSIADMVPAAMFIDGVSIYLAYYIWSLCPTASGQESSTRYLKIDISDLPDPESLGLDPAQVNEWENTTKIAFACYESAHALWKQFADENPESINLPKSLLVDFSPTAIKKRDRLIRNFAFDRARYFLPACAKTNVMLLMSARAWVDLIQRLLSSFLAEARLLGNLLKSELALVAPRLVRHAVPIESFKSQFDLELGELARQTNTSAADISAMLNAKESASHFEAWPPPSTNTQDLKQHFQDHNTRYDLAGSMAQRIFVRFSWDAVSFAEIRDLNRHRTGTKYCALRPVGFYAAKEQSPNSELAQKIDELVERTAKQSLVALEMLRARDPSYVYYLLLGHQFAFEHTTSLDKFVYEAELRTGVGSHFRYAKHLRDMLGHLYQFYPDLRGIIIEGSAEPE